MSDFATLQGGQSDLELAAADCLVLLRLLTPSTPVVTTLEAASGGLDFAKLTPANGWITVGNWTKRDGVSLTNNPTINDVESHGKGSPTRQLASKAEKSISYNPQENIKLINLQNAWGFKPSAVSGPSAHGGFTIQIPELPADLRYQTALVAQDFYAGEDLFRYWLANKANVGRRNDQKLEDANVDTLGVTLNFTPHNALPGVPVIFGVCGAGWEAMNAGNDTGFYPLPDEIDVTPTTKTLTVATGVNHTQQLTVTDSNGFDRTNAATYESSDPTKFTISAGGLMTGVAAGTGLTATATWGGLEAECAVTVTA